MFGMLGRLTKAVVVVEAPVMYGQSPYKSVKLDMQIADEVMSLMTTEELEAGGRCEDVSEECQR